MNAVVYVNGRISDAATAVVSVFDHGFLYGEGVYETLRTYLGRPFLLARHLERLRRSAALLSLDVPLDDDALGTAVRETTAALPGPGDAYIRVLLTRGVGDLTYRPSACPRPTLVILVKPLPGQPEWAYTRGIRLALVGVRRNHPLALNPMIKSNNLLNNALAMQEAYGRGADEALMLNQGGEIVECAQSNFFVVRGGAVETPPLDAGLLPGITRAFVMELATGLGLPCREAAVHPDDLDRVDEAFITGTTREITPVMAVDNVTIGHGTPGPITCRLLESFRARALELSGAT
jgi:branched-chain amino acid aminotransferase